MKFLLESGHEQMQKTISMALPELVAISVQSGSPMTDPWCARLAAQHLQYLIRSGEDMEKDLVTISAKELAAYDKQVRDWERSEVSRKRGAA